MTSKELIKARTLYIGHLLARGALYGVVIYFGADLIKNRMDFSDWVIYLGYMFVAFFTAELIINPIFRRKSRPWRFAWSIPPEDRWPRR